jgi:hypothetical protein
VASQGMVRGSEPRIGVKTGLYTAVMGALGCILTLFAIPVAPNIHINLYVFPGVLVGGTSGILLGALAGFIGSLYTPVLWGWLGAIPYAVILGASAGFFSRRGLRPTIGAFIGHVIAIPYSYWSTTVFLGVPLEIFMVGMVTTVVQLLAAGVIAEAIIGKVPALKKRLPRMEISAPRWIATNRFLRHPWITDADVSKDLDSRHAVAGG